MRYVEAMKTALLHYWLTNMRGGEKVLAALQDMFPTADIFTHALAPAMRDKVEVIPTFHVRLDGELFSRRNAA